MEYSSSWDTSRLAGLEILQQIQHVTKTFSNEEIAWSFQDRNTTKSEQHVDC
jgi:hypothetical protein